MLPFVLLLTALLTALGCGEPDPIDAGAALDAGETDGGTNDGGPSVDAFIDVDASIAASCLAPDSPDTAGTDQLDSTLGRATVSMDDRAACLRSYTLTSTATLRDARPDNPRTVAELAGSPTLRTGHDLFDALYALALEEVRENSVSSVRDFAFNDGEAVSCGTSGCFETGRIWNYVWTRDIAYSVDLGLGVVDPARARGSLEFKLSERRGGGDLQVVQDTGSGGSYPVSSDRVAWAMGAATLLEWLHPDERTTFRDRTLEALRNTIEHDRRVVYDSADGLYFGEQSFLDWREQTYPEWVTGDVVHIAMSKALSTNLLHLRAIELVVELSREVGASTAPYESWASALRTAIGTRFWLASEGLFSTYATTGLDPAPVRRFDLLGLSLSVLMHVATEAQADEILARYPHYGPGAPVVWPQQQDVRVYHNRGEWPFVTSYWLRAAAHAGNDAVADRMVAALVRGAALNLSNMENFEAASGAPFVDEGASSGPVVNSQRQLWSVAGYLSMVHRTLFGISAGAGGLSVAPFVTAGLRDSMFAGTDQLVLNDVPYRDGRVSIVLNLPASGGTGVLEVASIELDGTAASGPFDVGSGRHLIEITLAQGSGTAATLTEVSDTDYRDVFGPRTPRISSVSQSGARVVLTLDPGTEDPSAVSWQILRDGAVIAVGLPGTTTSFTDPDHDATSSRSPCYVAELTFTSSGTHSQHSPPECFWGSALERITTIDASAMSNVGGSGSNAHGRFHYEPWGDPGHSLTVPSFVPTQTGTHLFQVTFGNGAGPVDTGITCGVKRLVVEDAVSGALIAEGMLVMPHLGDWARWEDSSFVSAELEAGRSYRIIIRGDEDASNMSAFAHFETYTAGLGGTGGAFGRVNIAELKILAR